MDQLGRDRRLEGEMQSGIAEGQTDRVRCVINKKAGARII